MSSAQALGHLDRLESETIHMIRGEVPPVPVYFAGRRLVAERGGVRIVADDVDVPPGPGDEPQERPVRVRRLGRFPLTGAVKRAATTVMAGRIV